LPSLRPARRVAELGSLGGRTRIAMSTHRKTISGAAVLAVCVVVAALFLDGDSPSPISDSKEVTLSLLSYTNGSGFLWATLSITNAHSWPIECIVAPPWVEGDPFTYGIRIQGGNPPRVPVAARGVATFQVPVPGDGVPWRARVVYEQAPSQIRRGADRLSMELHLPPPKVRQMPRQFIGYSSLITK